MLVVGCQEKGYDAEAIRRLLAQRGYQAYILSRGEEAHKCRTPGYRARRWVVERTHAWFRHFRRLLIRWEKKAINYKAVLLPACANTIW